MRARGHALIQKARSRCGRGTISALLCQVLTSAVNLLTSVVIARVAGLEQLGLFSLGFLMVQIARNFQTSVLLAPMSAIAPTLSRAEHQGYSNFLVRSALWLALLSSGLILLATAGPEWIGLGAWLPGLALPLLGANLFTTLTDYVRRYHFVFDAPLVALRVDAVRNAVQTAGMVGLAFAGPGLLSAETALLCMAAGGIAGTTAGLIRHMRPVRIPAVTAKVRPRHAHFIHWMTPAFVLETVQMNVPYFLASAFLSSEAVGLARAMHQFANLINLPINALQHIVPTLAAQARAAGSDAQMNRLLVRIVLAGAGFVGFLGLALFVSADWIIPLLLGSAPEGAFVLLMAFLGLNTMLLLRFPLMIRSQTKERPFEIAAGAAGGALVATGAVLILAGGPGALTIPLASALAIATNTLVLFAINLWSAE